MEVKYYICKHCGNIVEKVKDKGVPVGSHVHVVVGETKHPMLEEHFIEWITLNTNQGIYRKQINPGQEPEMSPREFMWTVESYT